MRPADLGLPPKFVEFRSYAGFDQFQTALKLATGEARHEILNAPTGTGKSLLNATIAKLRKARRTLVLVGTKGLQNQLLGDGLVDRIVYGHRNYSCVQKLAGQLSDADADDPEFRCAVPRDRCRYNLDVDLANAAEVVCTNYAYWLSIGRYGQPGLLGEFDLLVCDEGHGAATWLTNAVTVYLSRARLGSLLGMNHWPTLPEYKSIGEWHNWTLEYKNKALDRLDWLDEKDPRRRKVDRLVGDLRLLGRVSHPNVRELTELKEPWIVIPGETDASSGNKGVKFSPQWGSDFAERLLFRGIPKVVLASATITRQHAAYLGLSINDESVCRYTEVPSPFDPRRRPLIYIPTIRVDFRMTEGGKWKLHQRVDQIIEAVIRKQAGNVVIHTGSYERNRELLAALSGKWYAPAIISHRQPKAGDPGDFEQALDRFKVTGREGRFAIMVSPRMQEGVDLPGELARVQMILKVPFPYSLDPLTKARAEDGAYRNMYVAEVMMQMAGRAVRGNKDFATTFILDDHWWQHAAKNSPFPQWFRLGFRKLDLDAGESIEDMLLTQEMVDALGPWVPPVTRQVQLIGG